LPLTETKTNSKSSNELIFDIKEFLFTALSSTKAIVIIPQYLGE